MRIHLVAERELRAAARRKATYWVRWLTGVVSFVVLIWLMWVTDALTRTSGVHDAFVAFAFIVFFYCLLMGAIRTADCISSERREGTLGLLFLTNLNSAEIVIGKLFSNALPTIYGLLAIFPMLALPLLMGGVTLAEFLCTMLALLAAIAFSLGCGMIASVLCRRQFPAVALSMGLVIVLSTGTFLAAGIVEEFARGHPSVQVLASTSPLYALSAALEGKIFRANHYWPAVGNVMVIALLLLGLATLFLARSWRDKAHALRPGKLPAAVPLQLAASSNQRRDKLRRRLLAINPFYWLAARRQLSAPIFMLIVAALVLLTVTGTTPFFSKLSSPARIGPALGEMFAWLCMAAVLHVMTLYYAAMLGAQSFAEDKQSGALELILSTPARVNTMLGGVGLAFRRRMLFPAIAVTLTHAWAFWKIMAVALIEPPGSMNTAGATQWDMVMAALFNIPYNGRTFEWSFVMVMRVIAMILPMAFVLWFTLARIGRWLGLSMKHPGFAPLLAIAMVVTPSILFITLMAVLADEFHLYRYNERIVAPTLIGLSFLIVLGNSAVAGGWASRNLRDNLRSVVIGRFDRIRRSWASRIRSLAIMAAKTAAALLVLGLLIVCYYHWQNVRSRRAWTSFQAELRQKKISLDIASVLPEPVPEADNFAQAGALVKLTTSNNPSLAGLLSHLDGFHGNIDQWKAQHHLPLVNFVGVVGLSKPARQSPQNPNSYSLTSPLPEIPDSYSGSTNNPGVAALLLKHFESYQADLQELAEAARRPHFQPVTNPTALDILQGQGKEVVFMRRLNLIYTLRALALLQTGQSNAAAEDVLTGLRLARLAGQSPYPEASGLAQTMLISSIQPLWEGLEAHQWNDASLAAFHTELATIDPTADFTRAIRIMVRANVAYWRTLPDQPESLWQIPDGNNYTYTSDWQGMNRGWWYDCCIDLYKLGEDAIADATPQRTNLPAPVDWGAVNRLPLNHQSEQLFMRMIIQWGGATSQNVYFGQTALNQARIAVALERHRLSHQNHATKLDQIIPEFLATIPIDPIPCRPLLFEPGTNGNYILRGVGPNLLNDRTNSSSDDWIWAYPTNAPAADTSP
jgi:ABC-type transport system involved in multi-copper enzyme maturation permease subunit